MRERWRLRNLQLRTNLDAQSAMPPLADPSASDPNESGCICKGALLGIACLTASYEELKLWLTPQDEARLSSKIKKIKDGCWRWKGATSDSGQVLMSLLPNYLQLSPDGR